MGQVCMAFIKCIAAGYVLFCASKENQKGRRCPQGMKAPVGLLSRRPVCEANATTCYDPLPVKKQSRNDRSHSGFAIYKNNNSAVYGAAHAEPF